MKGTVLYMENGHLLDDGLKHEIEECVSTVKKVL